MVKVTTTLVVQFGVVPQLIFFKHNKWMRFDVKLKALHTNSFLPPLNGTLTLFHRVRGHVYVLKRIIQKLPLNHSS